MMHHQEPIYASVSRTHYRNSPHRVLNARGHRKQIHQAPDRGVDEAGPSLWGWGRRGYAKPNGPRLSCLGQRGALVHWAPSDRRGLNRVLDGLASTAANGQSTAELGRVIKHLVPRWFLMRDVHARVAECAPTCAPRLVPDTKSTRVRWRRSLPNRGSCNSRCSSCSFGPWGCRLALT